MATLGNLALVLSQQGRYDEALPLSLRSLEGERRVHGPEHVETIISAINHADLLRRMGKHREAEALSRSMLVISRGVCWGMSIAPRFSASVALHCPSTA